ncbi:MAG: ArnT family glycosyltransferase [Chitinophagaceae bacterium]
MFSTTFSYKKNTYTFLAIVAIFKVIAANFVELGNDEAYYYSYALAPALNYFDHPPMIAWLIQVSTLNLTGVTDACMRLGPIITSTIASIFIFKTTVILRNAKAGWYAVLLYQASVYGGFIAGWFVLPDAPQAPFWCAALYFMASLIVQQKENQSKTWYWLGICIGAATLSKVHGLYLWAGFGLYILIHKRNWMLNFRLYLSFLITLLFTTPILIWNIQNNFITYKFHSSRVVVKNFNSNDLLREIVGEILYQNPVVYGIILIALIYFFKRKIVQQNQIIQWLLCMSLPMIFLFWYFASYNPIFPHWSGPAFVALIIIAALYIEQHTNRLFPKKITLSLALVYAVVTVAIGFVQFAPRNFGSQDVHNYGEYCPTLDVSGWKDLSIKFKELKQQDILQNQMQSNSAILVNKWFPAAQLEYYVGRLTHTNLIATGTVEDVHQFAWLNENRHFTIGQDAYVIVPSNMSIDVDKIYAGYFKEIKKPVTINQIRSNKVVRYFYIWRLKNCIDTTFKTTLK